MAGSVPLSRFVRLRPCLRDLGGRLGIQDATPIPGLPELVRRAATAFVPGNLPGYEKAPLSD